MTLKLVPEPSNSKQSNKTLPKYQKPHCIIPNADIQWVINQTKCVQILWGESWDSDPYGSRWVRIDSRLSDRSFREAKKKLQLSGMFEFKPNPSTVDGRSTDGWLVRNMHGARRINDYWQQPEQEECYQELPQKIDGINLPDNGKNLPLSGKFMPDNGKNLPSISPETIEKPGVPESLSNSSVTPQEHLKGVTEVVEEVANDAPLEGGHPGNELELKLRQKIADIEARTDIKGSQKRKQIGMFKSILKRVTGGIESMYDFFEDLFTNIYNLRLSEDEIKVVCSLTENQQRSLVEKIKGFFTSKGYMVKSKFEEILFKVKNSISDGQCQLAYDV